jgi:hypothetical protein
VQAGRLLHDFGGHIEAKLTFKVNITPTVMSLRLSFSMPFLSLGARLTL